MRQPKYRIIQEWDNTYSIDIYTTDEFTNPFWTKLNGAIRYTSWEQADRYIKSLCSPPKIIYEYDEKGYRL